jgi:hypothetical protein
MIVGDLILERGGKVTNQISIIGAFTLLFIHDV